MAPRHRQTDDALELLGVMISRARRARHRSIADMAERAGVSVPTVRKAERGDPGVAIGTVFELAVLLGVPLFDADGPRTAELLAHERSRLALLPTRFRRSMESDDDF